MESSLPPEVESARSRVGIGFKEIANSHGTYSANAYALLGFDNSFDMDQFRAAFTAKILHQNGDELIFEFVGIDAPIANAVRRILLAEVPTVAIETVYVHDNSSIVPDEMLAHRLGLIPLAIDPRNFEMKKTRDEPVTPTNTVRLRLKARCDRNPAAPRDGLAPPEKLYSGAIVHSGAIEYVSMGNDVDQVRLLNLHEVPRTVDSDIVIAKMRPTERIHVEMEAVKGIGKDHAKFSPVATASYRMLPEVIIKEQISGDKATQLVELCPMKVFDIEDSIAVVRRPRDCTMCRECIRKPEWSSLIELNRVRNHFVFSVESTGALSPDVLVCEAMSVLAGKCGAVLSALNKAVLNRGISSTADRYERRTGERRTGTRQNVGENTSANANEMMEEGVECDESRPE